MDTRITLGLGEHITLTGPAGGRYRITGIQESGNELCIRSLDGTTVATPATPATPPQTPAAGPGGNEGCVTRSTATSGHHSGPQVAPWLRSIIAGGGAGSAAAAPATGGTITHTAPWARPTTTSQVLATLRPAAWLHAAVVANRVHGTPVTTAQRRRVRHLLRAAWRLGIAERGMLRGRLHYRRRVAGRVVTAAELLAADLHATLTLLGGSADQATLFTAAGHARPDLSMCDYTQALRILADRRLVTIAGVKGDDIITVAR